MRPNPFPWKIGALGAALVLLIGVGSGWAEPVPGGTLDVTTVPKFVTPLPIPQLMPDTGTADNYEIEVVQFEQNILPPGYNKTTIWSYGAVGKPETRAYPARTIEATVGTEVTVKWVNNLKDPVTGKYAPSSPIAAGSNREIVEVWCGLIQRADVDEIYQRVHVLFLEHQKNGAVPVLDLDVFFGRLRGRGLRLGLATMDSEQAARAAMLRAKCTHHLDFICGFDTGHGVKPLGGMVEAFARSVGVTITRTQQERPT